MSERLRVVQEYRGAVCLAPVFTNARAGNAWLIWALLLATLPCGCATAPHPTALVAPESAPVLTDEVGRAGTIAVVRPIAALPAGPAAPRGDILAAIGLSPATTPVAAATPADEVIVRTDRGETLSVVEPAATAFRPGARVRILAGSPISVLPLVAPASAP